MHPHDECAYVRAMYVCLWFGGKVAAHLILIYHLSVPENDSEVESGSNLPGTTNMTRPA